MNQKIQEIWTFVEQDNGLLPEQKDAIHAALKAVNKELEILAFKLDRTEKVKRTTAILLEETIQELEQKRMAVEESRAALERSLEELKAAQQQLIQSEKMASLGELTAGIAHEIQNPLNFVNNFSDLSAELIRELVDELDNGNTDEAKAIAGDLTGNLEKIHHHGERAAAIVKGMLQHSRSSSGQKEPTDINALCDEYLRLAYHGLRANNKSFNAAMKTEFDPAIGMIPVVPQDIGRVLLNLINNAFYAVQEREKLLANSQQLTASTYTPAVSISTKRAENKVEIRITDNGNGIPQKVLDKIFQPFFTTKPTGEGTGLGLSLSYDIVKAHGGELKVETLPAEAAAQAGKEGEGLPAEASAEAGTVFTVSLPYGSL